jgi:hypothetical protein
MPGRSARRNPPARLVRTDALGAPARTRSVILSYPRRTHRSRNEQVVRSGRAPSFINDPLQRRPQLLVGLGQLERSGVALHALVHLAQ